MEAEVVCAAGRSSWLWWTTHQGLVATCNVVLRSLSGQAYFLKGKCHKHSKIYFKGKVSQAVEN